MASARILCLAVLAACLVSAFGEQSALRSARSTMANGPFSYSRADLVMGPLAWGNVDTRCDGVNQSPIDINQAVYTSTLTSVDAVNYTQWVNATCQYDGRLLTCVNPNATAGNNIIQNGPLNGQYVLSSINFHSTSEHTVMGQSQILEAQFVHTSTNPALAVETSPYQLAIVSVFFAEGNNNTINPFLDQFLSTFTSLKTLASGTNAVIPSIEFIQSGAFTSSNAYYTYQGSITTPNCRESVTWIVYDQVQLVGSATLAQFSQIMGPVFSNRPVQALGIRSLRTNSLSARASQNNGNKLSVAPSSRINISFQSLLAAIS